MKRYALLLAANRFADPEINNLQYAEQDANVLAGVLRESGCFEVVKTLTGPALRKDVALDTARDFARQLSAAGGGLLKLFYAGHGYRYAGKDLFLCPEARLADLDEFDHVISTDRLKAVTAQPGVERLLVTDSCRTHLRAGRDAGQARFELGLRNLVAAADPETRVGGWSLLAACAEGEQACELPELEHGAFCHAYVEALRQARRNSREVRLDDTLMDAVRANLREVLTRYQRTNVQNPWRLDGGLPPVILDWAPGESRPAPKRPIETGEKPVSEDPGGSVLLRLQQQARTRGADLARRKAAFERLYPAYEELRGDRHIDPKDLAEAWTDLCRSCGLSVIPATPGDLEWHGDGVQVVTRPVTPSKKEVLPQPKVAPVEGIRAPKQDILDQRLRDAGFSDLAIDILNNRFELKLPPLESFMTGESPRAQEDHVNSLGMKFVPVVTSLDEKQSVLFSIWETRVKDYAAYASANPGVNEAWRSPGFEQGDTHPVVNVNWDDAQAFCVWLTAKERQEGKIGPSQAYRLPTDAEWSWSVGIGEAEERAGKNRSPQEKDMKIEAGSHAWAYPWGKDYPPPKGAGNYRPSLKVDDYDQTSPVGSFGANAQGLYDLGGNVWEWVEDFYARKSDQRVLRGGSWNGNAPRRLLSSCRNGNTPGVRYGNVGFRVVLVSGSAR